MVNFGQGTQMYKQTLNLLHPDIHSYINPRHSRRLPHRGFSAFHVSQQISHFPNLLHRWIKLYHRHHGPSLLVYIVGDDLGDYKRLPLSCAALKKCRQTKLQILKRQCPRERVHVYLAKLTTSIDYDTAINNEVSEYCYGASDKN